MLLLMLSRKIDFEVGENGILKNKICRDLGHGIDLCLVDAVRHSEVPIDGCYDNCLCSRTDR